MTLKEQMAGDVADLFFMLSDFGETHEIEGEPIDIVVDNDELLKLKTDVDVVHNRKLSVGCGHWL